MSQTATAVVEDLQGWVSGRTPEATSRLLRTVRPGVSWDQRRGVRMRDHRERAGPGRGRDRGWPS